LTITLSIWRANTSQLMVQTLLADRFKLMLHRERKELSAYVISVGKTAPKLFPPKDDETNSVRLAPQTGPAQKMTSYRVVFTRFTLQQLPHLVIGRVPFGLGDDVVTVGTDPGWSACVFGRLNRVRPFQQNLESGRASAESSARRGELDHSGVFHGWRGGIRRARGDRRDFERWSFRKFLAVDIMHC
jgi:hypothetical protein